MSDGNLGYTPGRSLQFFTRTAAPLETPDDLIFYSQFMGPEADEDDLFTDSQPIDDLDDFSDELVMNIGCVPDSDALPVDRNLGQGFRAFLSSSLPAWSFGAGDGKNERPTALLLNTRGSAFGAGDDKAEGPVTSPLEASIVSLVGDGEVGYPKAQCLVQTDFGSVAEDGFSDMEVKHQVETPSSVFDLLRRRRSKSTVVALAGTSRQQGPGLAVDAWAEFEQSPSFRALRGWVSELGNRSLLPPKKRFKVAGTRGLKLPMEG